MTTLNLATLTEEQKDAFVEGWENAGGFMGDLDTPNPWCCPWDWNDEIEVEGDSRLGLIVATLTIVGCGLFLAFLPELPPLS